jgi:hypothetical protein
MSAHSKDFSGARGFLTVNYLMTRGALVVGLGFLTVCFPVAAQQTNPSEPETIAPKQLRRSSVFDVASAVALSRPEIFTNIDSAVLIDDLALLALLDGRLPVSTALGRMGMAPLDLFPVAFFRALDGQKVNAALVHRTDRKDSGTEGKDSPGEMMSSSLSPVYYGGEVGILYGRWSGKFGGDFLQTYIVGQVGNEKFQITAGAAYEESSGRALRFRSFTPLR